ncbi:hypothetical protein HPB47_025407 [Ixodes persulcatus]|uniref:Uncharacterized protein n=1 Tax=Ixodes persulcatus TaxID=34615 RepID=A0AC60Q2U1_IXOPE|nr:hypothetical protein HPB47_025407 [Ixodes persulcatus]
MPAAKAQRNWLLPKQPSGGASSHSGRVELDLTKYCSERADFAGVQVRTRRKDIVIGSAYIHPLGKWRPHVLAEMRAELGTDKNMLIGADFNAHNGSWGDGKKTAGGRRLQKLLDTTDFEEIGTGTPNIP